MSIKQQYPEGLEYLRHNNNDDPVCPHCDETVSVADNELFELYSDEETQFTAVTKL